MLHRVISSSLTVTSDLTEREPDGVPLSSDLGHLSLAPVWAAIVTDGPLLPDLVCSPAKVISLHHKWGPSTNVKNLGRLDFGW